MRYSTDANHKQNRPYMHRMHTREHTFYMTALAHTQHTNMILSIWEKGNVLLHNKYQGWEVYI